MQRIIGLVFSGFMVRLYAVAFACYTSYYAVSEIVKLFGSMKGLPL